MNTKTWNIERKTQRGWVYFAFVPAATRREALRTVRATMWMKGVGQKLRATERGA
jgi:hypothetical protein